MTKIIASCKCGKQEIDVKELKNDFGYLDKFDWQCPKCWSVVDLSIKKEGTQNNDKNQS